MKTHAAACWRVIAVLMLSSALAGSLIGCTGTGAAEEVSSAKMSRDYGATDPCQFTVLDLEPKPGVDLNSQGQKVIDGFEDFEAIGVVTLYPNESRLEVTWCNSMQTEQGVVRAVAQTNLATIANVATSPNTQK